MTDSRGIGSGLDVADPRKSVSGNFALPFGNRLDNGTPFLPIDLTLKGSMSDYLVR